MRDPNGIEVEDDLKARTTAAVQAGVFGVPTFRLDDGRVFWGQDSLVMLGDEIRTATAR